MGRGANIYGFNKYTEHNYLFCPIDHACLIRDKTDPNLILCPVCGMPYSEIQVNKMEEENNKPALTPKVSPGNTRPALMQVRS